MGEHDQRRRLEDQASLLGRPPAQCAPAQRGDGPAGRSHQPLPGFRQPQHDPVEDSRLAGAQTGVVGQPSLPPDYPKADSVYFFFLVDSNHDGRFGNGDIGYNLVWQSGIYLTHTEYSDRTVYDLTTDLTSPNAELIQGVGNGGTSKGTFCVPLRLMVTRLK